MADELGNLMSKPEYAVYFRLREFREARGLSQTDLAKLVDSDPAWIGHMESGRRLPALGNACRLADALGVSLDALCGRETTGFEAGYRRGAFDAVEAMKESTRNMRIPTTDEATK